MENNEILRKFEGIYEFPNLKFEIKNGFLIEKHCEFKINLEKEVYFDSFYETSIEGINYEETFSLEIMINENKAVLTVHKNKNEPVLWLEKEVN